VSCSGTIYDWTSDGRASSSVLLGSAMQTQFEQRLVSGSFRTAGRRQKPKVWWLGTNPVCHPHVTSLFQADPLQHFFIAALFSTKTLFLDTPCPQSNKRHEVNSSAKPRPSITNITKVEDLAYTRATLGGQIGEFLNKEATAVMRNEYLREFSRGKCARPPALREASWSQRLA